MTRLIHTWPVAFVEAILPARDWPALERRGLDVTAAADLSATHCLNAPEARLAGRPGTGVGC